MDTGTAEEDPLVRAREEIAKALEATRVAQQAQAKAEAEAAEATKAAQQLQEGFECSLEQLPKVVLHFDPDTLSCCHSLWSGLHALAAHEATIGASVPVTFEHLQCGLEVPRMLLGDAIWRAAYPTAEPAATTYLSTQVRRLLVIALETQRDLLESGKEEQAAIRTAAAKRVGDAVESFKKRRLSRPSSSK
jgi:hypothetical protein